MITTHNISDFDQSDNTAQVTFFNEQGYIFKKSINIPHTEDGRVNVEEFNEIIIGQIRGCNHKEKLGLIKFTDPNNNDVDSLNPPTL